MKLASQCVLRGEFCIIYKQDPKRVLPFAKLFITLWSREDYIFSALHIDEIVFAFILIQKI